MPQTVHQAQGGVTILYLGHEDTHRPNIVHLGETDSLALHFAPDTVNVLGTALYLNFQPGVVQRQRQLVSSLGYELIALSALAIQQTCNFAIGVTVDIAERQIFQFPLQMANAETVRQRRIDIENLSCDRQAALIIVFDSANSAGAFGQLDQRHPDVIHQRDQHLAYIVLLALRLAQYWLITTGAQFADSSHAANAFNQLRNACAEGLRYPLCRNPLLANSAIKNPRQQAICSHLQFGQYQRGIQSCGKTV